MTRIALILLTVLVLASLIVVVGQMCESGSMWLVHVCCGTPGALCTLLGLILAAIFEND